MTISDYIQLGAMIITFGATLVAIVALYKSIKQFRNQLQLNFFTEYTKRYQEITLNFPSNINSDSFDFDKLKPKEKEILLRNMRAYFDLCSEEYHQYQQGYIDTNTWKEWKEGIELTFSKKAFRDGWKILSFDTHYYNEFYDLIRTLKSDV